MELKVWVEGIQRVICGVTETTTCQDVVIALAHATNKTGRFTLIEKWRDNERLLAPAECPLRVLQKWGEYASDVQFILRHSDKSRGRGIGAKRKEKFLQSLSKPPESKPGSSIKKSLTFSGAHTSYLAAAAKHRTKRLGPENSSLESLEEQSSYTSHSSKSSASPCATLEKRSNLPTQHVSPYNSLEKHRPSPGADAALNRPPSSQSSLSSSSRLPVNGDAYRTSPSRVSPSGGPEEYDLGRHLGETTEDLVQINGGFSEQEFKAKLQSGLDKSNLTKLVQLQQEKLGVQESQLKILESEIQYWTQREKDYDQQAELFKLEAERLSQTEQSLVIELQELDLVSWSDKLEVEKQTEKTLQSELTLMRSTLANAESELLQAKNKVHTLTSDIEKENQLISQAESDEKDQELKLEQEVSDLQKQVNATLDHGEQNDGELDQVQKEVNQLENEILERKMQIEKYERDLKECNLEGFMKAPTELVIPALDDAPVLNRLSPARPGSARKMTHSPQLLKETVATPKNPHGLWV